MTLRLQLTAEQIEIIQACGSRALPIADYRFHLLAQQRRIFHFGDEAVVVRRPSGFLETHGTLGLLLTQHMEAVKAAAVDWPASVDLPGETRVPMKDAASHGGHAARVPRHLGGWAAAVSDSTSEPNRSAAYEHPAEHEAAPSKLLAEDCQRSSPKRAQAAQSNTDPARQPAVPVEDSIHPDHLICLEDGRELKMLTRHLRAAYGLSPEQYRERWSLPPDYPMVAADTAERRLLIARQPRPGAKAHASRKHGTASTKP